MQKLSARSLAPSLTPPDEQCLGSGWNIPSAANARSYETRSPPLREVRAHMLLLLLLVAAQQKLASETELARAKKPAALLAAQPSPSAWQSCMLSTSDSIASQHSSTTAVP